GRLAVVCPPAPPEGGFRCVPFLSLPPGPPRARGRFHPRRDVRVCDGDLRRLYIHRAGLGGQPPYGRAGDRRPPVHARCRRILRCRLLAHRTRPPTTRASGASAELSRPKGMEMDTARTHAKEAAEDIFFGQVVIIWARW